MELVFFFFLVFCNGGGAVWDSADHKLSVMGHSNIDEESGIKLSFGVGGSVVVVEALLQRLQAGTFRLGAEEV